MFRCLVAVALVLAATWTPASAMAADPPIVIRTEVTWTVEDRFGLDADGDGRIDLPNTPEYVFNRRSSCPSDCPDPRFVVHFDAGLSGASGLGLGTIPILSYEWTISGGTLPDGASYVRPSPHLDLALPEGRYQVEMRLLVRIPWGTITTRTEVDVTVEDLLIVAIGDSYASGEGNPEVPRNGSRSASWAQGGSPYADGANAAAHRSTVAWPARVALAMELSDPQTSVTFVSMAATGARIDAGLLNPQAAELPVSQVDALRAVVGDRPVDLLLIQVGGNDIGFSRVVRGLVEADPLFDPICYHQEVANVFDGARDGDWTRGVGITFALPFHWGCRVEPAPGPQYPGLDGLADGFGRLAAALDGIDVRRVAVVSYPDPTGSDTDGGTCREIVGDATPPFGFHEVDEQEQAAAIEQVLRPLNARLGEIARGLGWEYVGGIAEAFAAGHGYCARWPDYGRRTVQPGTLPVGGRLGDPDSWYRNPGRFSGAALIGGADVTWYRTAEQSSTLQGPVAPYATSGTLHPNELGHASIARRVLEVLALTEN